MVQRTTNTNVQMKESRQNCQAISAGTKHAKREEVSFFSTLLPPRDGFKVLLQLLKTGHHCRKLDEYGTRARIDQKPGEFRASSTC